jgi:hypothetical protein
MNITYMLHVVRVAVARGDLSIYTAINRIHLCTIQGDYYTTRNLLDHLAFIYLLYTYSIAVYNPTLHRTFICPEAS